MKRVKAILPILLIAGGVVGCQNDFLPTSPANNQTKQTNLQVMQELKTADKTAVIEVVEPPYTTKAKSDLPKYLQSTPLKMPFDVAKKKAEKSIADWEKKHEYVGEIGFISNNLWGKERLGTGISVTDVQTFVRYDNTELMEKNAYDTKHGYTGDPFTCKVTKIKDGDTFDCLVVDSGRSETIRLRLFDAPEKGQAGAEESAKELADNINCGSLILDESCETFAYVGSNKKDKYNRTVGAVYGVQWWEEAENTDESEGTITPAWVGINLQNATGMGYWHFINPKYANEHHPQSQLNHAKAFVDDAAKFKFGVHEYNQPKPWEYRQQN